VYKKLVELTEEVIDYWAENGLAGGLEKAWDAGSDFMKEKVNEWEHHAEDVLKNKVGPTVDHWREVFGDVRPEDKPVVVIPMPTGTGVYVKIDHCTNPKGHDRPYWRCGIFANAGDDIDEVRDTDPGVKRDDGLVYWDWQENENDRGFGIFWRDEAERKCVQCWAANAERLGYSLRMGIDKDFDDENFALCTSQDQFEDVDVGDDGGVCRVFFHVTE